MIGQTIYSAKIILRLFEVAFLVLIYTLFSHTAHSESLTNELISASKNGNVAKLQELIAKGVNVNEKDEYGSTAIIYSVTADSDDGVKLLTANVAKALLSKGADPGIKNDSGTTAIMIAEKLKKPEMMELLSAADK